MSTNATSALFDDRFLKKLEHLSFISRRLLSGELMAERKSRKRGSGLEFADYRSYVAGDDFRHLDWKAYLRLNRLILRLFEEEQDVPIYILVDSSRSMDFGTPSKLDYSRRIAAALCYIGLANLDRVHIVSYAGNIASELSSQRGKNQIFNVFRFLTDIIPAGETDARTAFLSWFSESKRRGLAVVISDFFDSNGFEGGLDVLRHFRHDVFAIHIASADEAEPQLQGDLLLVDAEDRMKRDITVTPALLRAYRAEFERHCKTVESYCGRYELGYVRTITDFPFEDLVLRIFRQGRFLK
jgi:uncharacterized protein (DUF58 family)